MKPKNFTGSEKWTETENLLCWTPSFADGTVEYLKGFSVSNILLSITAFLENTLISLHQPSKLLFCCLAMTDLCWTDRITRRCHFSSILGIQMLQSLSIRHTGFICNQIFVVLSIFVDDDGCGIRPFAHGASLHCITWYFMKLVLSIMAGVHWWSYNGHKPWQTFRPDFGDEIQADCNVKTYIFRCSHHLGHSYSCSITVFCKPSYNSLVLRNGYTHVLNAFIGIVYKDFPHTSSSGPSARSCSTRTTT